MKISKSHKETWALPRHNSLKKFLLKNRVFNLFFMIFNKVYCRLFLKYLITKGYVVDSRMGKDSAYSNTIKRIKAGNIKYSYYEINVSDFKKFIEKYTPYYNKKDYYVNQSTRHEKFLEHYLTLKILNVKEQNRCLDIGCFTSPFAFILKEEKRADSWRHDMCFKTDLNKKNISGRSDSIDAPDNFFNFVYAQCAIDNFEGSADVELMHEMKRILAKNGVGLIIPFYLTDRAENITSLYFNDVPLDKKATRVVVPNRFRFGRHYSYDSFKNRLVISGLDYEIIILKNIPFSVSKNLYCRFALKINKRN